MTSVFLRPDADSSDGSWLNEASSGTNLFASVDDTTSTGADADYIRSSSAQGDKVRLRLSDPGVTVTSPMVVRYRVKAEALPAALVGRLYQGASTLVAYWEELPTTSFATYTYTLTTAEFNSITDFNDLYVEFEYDSAAPHLTGNIDLWFEADTYYDSSLDPNSDPAHLMLHFDGADASTVVTDTTGRHNQCSFSNSAQIDTAQSKFGGSSALFTGTDPRVFIAGGDGFAFGQDLVFGSGDFTIDFWVRLNSLAAEQCFCDFRPSGVNGFYPTIYISTGNVLIYLNNSATRITGTTTLSSATWYHVALTRSGTSTRLFLNGTQEGSTYSDSSVYLCGSGGRPVLGVYGESLTGADLDGWIDEFRIVKGTAVWTANFTPPTAAYAVQTGPYNLLSCSRASTGYGQTVAGTLTNFATNELRITDKGLLVEDARTNLQVRSQDLDTAGTWGAQGCTVTANSIAAPDGTTTAEKITATGSGPTDGTMRGTGSTLSANTTYTWSSYFKSDGTNTWIQLIANVFDGNYFGTRFNLTGAGTVGTGINGGDGSFTSGSIEALANGWYRCTIVGKFTAARTADTHIQGPNTTEGGSTVNGGFFYAWGVQTELGSFASSYIPTTTTSATRAKDSIQGIGNVVPILQLAYSGVSVVAELALVANQAPSIIAGEGGGGWVLYDSSTSPGKVSYARPGGIEATLGTPSTWSDGAKVGIANASALNDRAICGNGGTVVTDALGDDLEPFVLGTSDFGQSFLLFRRLTLWTTRLANATLQTLTST